MTSNEVDLHRSEKGHTALIIVSSIKLSRDCEVPTASGGQVEPHLRWDIDLWVSEPMAFKVAKATESP